MKSKLFAIFLFVVATGDVSLAQALSSRTPRNGQRPISGTARMIEKVQGTIVQIIVPLAENGGQIRGSGFWIERNLVATCWHVVAQNPTSTFLVQSAIDSYIDLSKGNVVNNSWVRGEAKLVARDEKNDLAILAIQGNSLFLVQKPLIAVNGKSLGAHFAVASLAKSLPSKGDDAYLGGYPLGRPFLVVQKATIAAITYDLPEAPSTVKVLVNTLANHGNSGGPIFDAEGNVVAVLEGAIPSLQNRDPAEAVSGIEFAIPIQYLKKLRSSVEQPKR